MLIGVVHDLRESSHRRRHRPASQMRSRRRCVPAFSISSVGGSPVKVSCRAGERLERARRGDVDAGNWTRDGRRSWIRALRGLAADEAKYCNKDSLALERGGD